MSSGSPQKQAELPVGWKWAKVGDVCDAIRGVTFKSGDSSTNRYDGSIPCITTSAVQSVPHWDTFRYIPVSYARYAKQFLQSGDILVSTANSKALVGKSCLVTQVPEPCVFGAFVTVLRPTNSVLSSWLTYTLQRHEAKEYFYSFSSNTTNISNLKTADLLNHAIPLPPLAEQKRMVAVLNEQMAAVECAKKAAEERLEAAQALRQGVLRSVWPALEGRLPRGWKWARLGDVCDVVTGSTPTKSNPRFYGGGMPWVNPSHLGLSRYVNESEEYLTAEGIRAARLVPKGAVLVTCISGSLSNIGKVSIAGRSLTTNQQINAVVAGPSIESEFLYYHILAIKHKLEALSASTNQNIVNKSKLSDVTLQVPPLEIQRRVAAELSERFEAVGSVERYACDCLESLGNLSSSILGRAFSGEI